MLRGKLTGRQWLFWVVSAGVFALALMLGGYATAEPLSTDEEHYALKLLGKFVFFDDISVPERQSCVSCHAPEAGGTNENPSVNRTVVAVPGANFHVSTGLKPPTNNYASMIEKFQECGRGGAFFNGGPGVGQLYCGGNFWDGRAEGNEGALFPETATKHIGDEIFQGAGDANGYKAYFGPTSDQALNPMPNPLEQNIGRKAVCEHVASSPYAELYEFVWGEPIDCRDIPVAIQAEDLDDGEVEVEFDISFKRLMLAVGAWQHSAEMNSFSSKRDKALRAELACLPPDDPRVADIYAEDPDFFDEYFDPDVCGEDDYINSRGTFPLVGFSKDENEGHDLFYNIDPPGPNNGPTDLTLPVTQCAFCHISDPEAPDGTGLFERYTDDAYHNIGTPANPDVPALPQKGIGGHAVFDPSVLQNEGFFKTPTLRNVDKRPYSRFIKAYAHNGWFKSLESIVHFYNTAALLDTAADFDIDECPENITSERRALRANCWPAPEWPGAAFGLFVGNQGMSAEQEAKVVSYLKTLTDSVTPEPPKLSEMYTLMGVESAGTADPKPRHRRGRGR